MVLSLRCVIGELRARGHVAGLEIPDGELTEAGAPALFVDVLAAFLAEVQVPCALPTLAMPPVFVADRPVDLLRLYLAVRSRGGFAAVSSWAAVAVALGLEPTAYSAIKLVYAKYLSLLEQSIWKPRKQDGVVESSGNADHRSKAKKGKFMSPHKDHASAGSSQLKRKRNVLVEMLNWVRLVAKSPGEHSIVGQSPGSQFPLMLMLRREMTASPQNGLAAEEQTQSNGWDELSADERWDRFSSARIRLCGVADVPEWPSLPYDEPHVLRFLGQPLLPPESNEALDADTIGMGRPDKCNCQLPGSIACIRFHVTEKKILLKRELGSAFYAMGFDRIGEDAALTWTKDEEEKFNDAIQNGLPSSKNSFWDKPDHVLVSKSRKGLVSYYYNVFQLRRRAYQNRLTPNDVDSDDDSI